MRLAMSRRAVGAVVLAIAAFAPPSQGQRGKAMPTWRAVEEWRVDGTESGEPFADLRDYVVLTDGTLWALDFKDQVIRRYASNGKSLGTVGRKGAGPGEFGNANGMLIAPDGLVWVNDPSNARFSIFSADGKFVRQVTSNPGGYGYRWTAWFNATNRELVEMSIAASSGSWIRRDQEAKTLGTVPYTTCPAHEPPPPGYFRAETKDKGSSNGAYPFAGGGGVAADGKGNLWCASTRGTRVALMRLGATDTVARTSIDIAVMPVTREEKASAIEKIEKRIAAYATNNFDRSKIPNDKSGIAALYVDLDGRLWVQHTVRWGEKQAILDAFDAKGAHLARVTLPARQRDYLPVRAHGDALWLTVVDDDDVPSIVKYRLQR